MDPEVVDKAVKEMTLTWDGEPVEYLSHSMLDPARQKVFSSAFPECGEGSTVVAILGKMGDVKKELVAVFTDGQPKLVTGSCQITYEDLSPSDCIEYCFAESGEWAMAQLSRDALETYRGMKFESWQKMLLEPTCEAQFRRMLHIGVVSRLYDQVVFPTPADLLSSYQVTDEKTGKLINLPHPVSALRCWNASAQAYESIDPHLTGAPAEEEKDAWWANMINDLKEKHGEEYVVGLIGGGAK